MTENLMTETKNPSQEFQAINPDQTATKRSKLPVYYCKIMRIMSCLLGICIHFGIFGLISV